MTSHDSPPSPQAQALDWLLRLAENPHDPGLQAACRHWRAADPAHERAWLAAERVWHLSGQLPAGTRDLWPTRAPSRRPRRRAVLALAACLLLGLSLLLVAPAWRADHRSGTGETLALDLDDGSRLWLAPQSAVKLRFDEQRRQVTLLRGEAFFEVHREAARPFVVEVGASRVEVTGTAFDVARLDAGLSVAVAHGSVRFSDPHAGERSLRAGDRLRYRAGEGARQDQVPVAQVAAWRERQLVVDGLTVGEVVERLDRYHPGVILLRDSRLAGRRVTGVFDLADPLAALRAALRPHGGEVRAITPFLWLVSSG